MTEAMDIPPEFSRPVRLETLSVAERGYEIEASPEECAALAERFGILAVDRLAAQLRLKMLPGGELVRLKAKFQARVRQACVITLEPVRQDIDDGFDLTYGPEEEVEDTDILVDLDADDPPEPIRGGAIDLGEAVAEHLALALDPFPRAPGAAFQEIGGEEEPAPEEGGKPHPFAALASLQKK
ncbi:hypothetical protein GALL_249140 [mine drainage metagenome]|uniref:DUF177 domain-containing protein n=1 Tax=mine drainage metagenome TaxID=410659 RepID=A0A1J5RAK4_9ZZZZ